jgi:hypothetical protein
MLPHFPDSRLTWGVEVVSLMRQRRFTPRKIPDDRLCGLVIRVLGYRSGGTGSIPGTTKKK